MGKRPARALVLVALVLASAGSARDASTATVGPTWRGVAASGLPFEAKATMLARVVAGHSVSIKCERTGSWRELGDRLGFDPNLSWAVTPFHWDSEVGAPSPDTAARFSPRACQFGASFWLDPSDRPARTCSAALERVQILGVADESDLADCDVWALRLTAVHVLSHETVHLGGFYDEVHADCLASQIDALTARSLGASAELARSIADEYRLNLYLPRVGGHEDAECRDGARLDLFPDEKGWPTPHTYPADLAPALSAVAAAVRAAGGTP